MEPVVATPPFDPNVIGHPERKWDALKQRIQAQRIRSFADVAGEWLDVMWTLDAYRTAGQIPEGMGKPGGPTGKTLAVDTSAATTLKSIYPRDKVKLTWKMDASGKEMVQSIEKDKSSGSNPQ